MKQISTTAIAMFIAIWGYGAVISAAPNAILEPQGFLNYNIEGQSLHLSFWDFNASGFQIDGAENNTALGLRINATGSALKELTAGSLIDATGIYPAAGGEWTSYYSQAMGSPSVIAVGASTYFGFRIKIAGNFRYGWIKITRTADDKLTINEYAYENTANKAIKAGDKTGTPSTSITNVNMGDGVSIYPIPAKNVLNINGIDLTKRTEFSIINMMGQLVKIGLLGSGGTSTIEIGELVCGNYTLILKTKSGCLIKRFWK